MTEVAQGTSLARFGHGELLIMAGEDAEYQKYDKKLAFELDLTLNYPSCLICVPPLRNEPEEWKGFLDKYGVVIDDDRWYGSSFVSRHDWVPWTEEYRVLITSLWKTRVVSLVSPAPIKLGNNAIVIIRCRTEGIFVIRYAEENDRSHSILICPGALLCKRIDRKLENIGHRGYFFFNILSGKYKKGKNKIIR